MDQRKSGFALVIALSLMAFVLLLLLSITTLVRVETQTAAMTLDRMKAQQNAYLGMMVALGELQRSVGPDQRVTAPHALISPPQVGTQHMTGVWRSDDGDGDGEADGEFLRWLASSRDPDARESLDFLDTARPVSSAGNAYVVSDPNFKLLVGASSVRDGADPAAPVQAIVAETVPFGEGGAYAWWVGDEGTKAKVGSRYTDTTFDPESIRALMAQRGGLYPLGAALSTDENYELAARMSSVGDFDIAFAAGSLTDDARTFFHDLTLNSAGVLTDVKNGGFKKNLTAAFIDTTEFAALLADAGRGPLGTAVFDQHDDSLPTREDPGGPNWSQFRSYFLQGQSVSGDQIPMITPTENDSNSPVTPIMTQAQFFVYPAYVNTGVPNEREVVYLFFPAVVLWNPYDKAIDCPDLFVRFSNFDFSTNNKKGSFEFGFAVEDSAIGNYPATSKSDLERVRAGAVYRYRLPATSFPAGQALIFSPSQNRPININNPGCN